MARRPAAALRRQARAAAPAKAPGSGSSSWPAAGASVPRAAAERRAWPAWGGRWPERRARSESRSAGTAAKSLAGKPRGVTASGWPAP